GDTFPVGCRHCDKVVYPECVEANPGSYDERYNSKYGVYEPNCGLDNVKMSWGHDEYLYQMMKDYLPEPAPDRIRDHAFYPPPRENGCEAFLSKSRKERFKGVGKLNPHDLYPKVPVPPGAKALRPYHEDLVAKYLPSPWRS